MGMKANELLMEWKHIAREAITAGPQTQQSNQTHGVE